MAFKIISKIADSIKVGVTTGTQQGSKGAVNVIRAIKDATVGTMKEVAEAVKEGIDVPASIVKGVFGALSAGGKATIETVRHSVSGTIQGYKQSGNDEHEAARGAIAQVMYEAKDAWLDIGEAAVAAVEGSIEGIKQIGGDTARATKEAVVAAMAEAEALGADAAAIVEEALEKNIKGAKEIIDSLRR